MTSNNKWDITKPMSLEYLSTYKDRINEEDRQQCLDEDGYNEDVCLACDNYTKCADQVLQQV